MILDTLWQHYFTTFYNIFLQHSTTLQLTTFYNIVQHLQHFTTFTTLRTTFYNILQHFTTFTTFSCSCRREAKSWTCIEFLNLDILLLDKIGDCRKKWSRAKTIFGGALITPPPPKSSVFQVWYRFWKVENILVSHNFHVRN